jgi:polysaccharide export outer membrane protein
LAYRIHPGDILEINVFGSPNMHNPPFRLRVSEDGTVSFPLLGRVKLGGLTEVEAIKKLDSMLMDGYLTDPQVTLIVMERTWLTAQRQFSIAGAVKKPGKYAVMGEMTIIDAISSADGFLPQADITEVKVIRDIDDAEVEYIIDMREEASMDFEIRIRDRVFVGSLGTYLITGQVVEQGEYALTENITASEAIVMAGGFTEMASRNGVKVIRQLEEGKTKVIRVPVGYIFKSGKKRKDLYLEKGDIVVVPEAWF